jgi:hypothetical protein
MTEHVQIKKIEKNGKEMIEISMYGDYDVIFSMLVNASKSYKLLSDLITDASLEINPILYDKPCLN